MATTTPLDPDTVPNLGIPTFTQGMVVQGAKDWLVLSGQVGLKPDGSIADDAAAQIEQCYTNIVNMLEAGGFGLDDLVFLRLYLVDPADIDTLRAARNRLLGTRKVPSTLLIISALARPEFKVEIEAVAAR